MDFYIDIRIGTNSRTIRFEHQLTIGDLDGFAKSRCYENFTDMVLQSYADEEEDKKIVLDKVAARDLDSIVEDYIKYDLCCEGALSRYLAWIYRYKAVDAFDDWVGDQISDFGEEYFMLEV